MRGSGRDGDGWSRASGAALLAALLLVVAGWSLAPVSETDLFFRLRAGQELLARHGLPARNLYSFTYPDHPDLDTSWLFELAAAVCFARTGFSGLVLAKTAVLVATFAGLFAVCRRRGAGPLAAALAVTAAAYVARERFVERPHIFSLAGEVALLAFIGGLEGPSRPARTLKLALGVLAAMALWANLHAGVFVAPGLLALAALGARLDRQPGAGRLGLAAALAAVATLATPVGTGLLTYLRLHLRLPALHPVDEFRAPTWISDAPWFVFAGAVALAASRVRPVLWRLWLPALAVGALAVRTVRFSADAAVLAAPLLALGLSRAGARLGARGPAGWRGTGPAWAVTALLVGVAVAPRWAAARQGEPALRLGLDESGLPLDAIRFADDNGLRERMYNDFELGSYLLFRDYPRHRVFVDPRLPAYPPEFHALLGRTDLTAEDWSAAMRRYGVDSALLAYAGLNRRVAWWPPAEWALVYRAHDARVFVRRLPRFRALIAARELPATFSFTLFGGAATVPLAEPPPGSPVPSCEWQRRLGDLLFELDGALSARAQAAYARALAAAPGCLDAADERRLCTWLGARELSAGHAAAALGRLERALALGDDETSTRANRALALEALARPSEAAAAWDQVARRAAGTPLGAKARARQTALAARPVPR